MEKSLDSIPYIEPDPSGIGFDEELAEPQPEAKREPETPVSEEAEPSKRGFWAQARTPRNVRRFLGVLSTAALCWLGMTAPGSLLVKVTVFTAGAMAWDLIMELRREWEPET